MTIKRLAVLVALVLVCAAVPSKAEAQICDETCGIFVDSDGNWLGFGCLTGGGYFVNCQATADRCSMDSCRLTSVTTIDGLVLAVGSSCEMQRLIDRLAEYSGEPYVDKRHLLSLKE